jgi:hypothetical protein
MIKQFIEKLNQLKEKLFDLAKKLAQKLPNHKSSNTPKNAPDQSPSSTTTKPEQKQPENENSASDINKPKSFHTRRILRDENKNSSDDSNKSEEFKRLFDEIRKKPEVTQEKEILPETNDVNNANAKPKTKKQRRPKTNNKDDKGNNDTPQEQKPKKNTKKKSNAPADSEDLVYGPLEEHEIRALIETFRPLEPKKIENPNPNNNNNDDDPSNSDKNNYIFKKPISSSTSTRLTSKQTISKYRRDPWTLANKPETDDQKSVEQNTNLPNSSDAILNTLTIENIPDPINRFGTVISVADG